MSRQGFDKTSVSWSQDRVSHDAEAFQEIEKVDYCGTEVRAYKHRPPSLIHLLDEAIEIAPERTFLNFPAHDFETNYRNFADRVEQLAAGLEGEGVGGGDRVAIRSNNCPAFVELLFAVLRLGATFVPFNTKLPTQEFHELVAAIDPDAVIATPAWLDQAAGELPNQLTLFKISSSGTVRPPTPKSTDGGAIADTSDWIPFGDTPAAAHPAPSDTAVIYFTSGTTGRPKGCQIDHFNLVNAALNNAFCFDFTDGTRSLVPTPLFHISGLVSGLLSVLPCSGSAVIQKEFSPDSFLRAIDNHEINYIMGVPTNYILAIENGNPSAYDLSSVHTCAYGSAPMPSERIKEIREAFPNAALSNTYGKTETTSGLASMCPDEDTDERPGSVGLPTPLVEYSVVDDEGRRLSVGEVGELAIRGGIVVSKYINRPDATEDEFEGGWHLTGDIGVIDESGFITLKGRDSDMIIRGGKNVYPLTVEDVLVEHRKVLEAAVTSFSDEILGQRVLAAVVPTSGARLTEDELRDHCAEALAEYKNPEIIRIVDSLPRNANGKVMKDELLPEPLVHGIGSGR